MAYFWNTTVLFLGEIAVDVTTVDVWVQETLRQKPIKDRFK